MEALIATMEEPQEKSTLLDVQFKLKDVVQLIGLLVGGVWFIVTMNSKIDNLTTAINELKDTGNKQFATQDLSIRNLQNQVQANQVQIQLIQKDVETLKTKK